ncbi:Phospho-2-dehydro-3-deoxyheptonate aldolase, Tyr-sensitive [Candidatus Portiera aleyrodidarum]|uniref:Phospho-2-dehydro-3-deoxyheptonate aldolase n=1 Tax=Candidatus Portiera aleyrodidarum TaxID=91844 RepID=A0A6S6RWL9_9GAMM|nr:3-deoxy-7-phosphoheptulonate synthase [Candidatus Portiera aleyrodidarum]CAA3708471.1 Phospho-2-dehydro-3-deoxyheptonate aldolase, Tyr-sensitive [Candidatus Portiera aleyrodidarum]
MKYASYYESYYKMVKKIDKIKCYQQLPSIIEIRKAIPINSVIRNIIKLQRKAIKNILNGNDKRLLVIVGPCSIHDTTSALEYANKLKKLSKELEDQMLVVMRAYIEKPRTNIGWKGFLYDPFLDESNDLKYGIYISRKLMYDISIIGLPISNEILNPITSGFFEDLISWGAIGARTTESQIHREVVSGVSFPIGFKNGTDGNIEIAIDAIKTAENKHFHIGIDQTGRISIIKTKGNLNTHLILRGGNNGPNYYKNNINLYCQLMTRKGIKNKIMVDCSHSNSGKNPDNQERVLENIIEQRISGNKSLIGIMLESNINSGSQHLSNNLKYGVSITDGCLSWLETENLLRKTAIKMRKNITKL